MAAGARGKWAQRERGVSCCKFVLPHLTPGISFLTPQPPKPHAPTLPTTATPDGCDGTAKFPPAPCTGGSCGGKDGAKWVVCQADATTAWVSSDAAGGYYNALFICQTLGYDKVSNAGGTCGSECGYCAEGTSCASPGRRYFDSGYGRGDVTNLGRAIQWECRKGA